MADNYDRVMATLTPAQRRMARQAGPAWNDEREAVGGAGHGGQLSILPDPPAPGDVYRNRHSHRLGTIVTVAQRRQAWVVIRADDRLSEIPLRWLTEFWERV